MSATLSVYRLTDPSYSYCPGNFFREVRKERCPDDWWEHDDDWTDLDDFVEMLDIDTDEFPRPFDYSWNTDAFLNAFFLESAEGLFELSSTRELEDPVPGEMYIGEGYAAKSAREITWTERLDILRSYCHGCTGTMQSSEELFGGLIVLEEAGEITRTWFFYEMGTCALNIAEDYRRVTRWEGSEPCCPVTCEYHEWD